MKPMAVSQRPSPSGRIMHTALMVSLFSRCLIAPASCDRGLYSLSAALALKSLNRLDTPP